MQNKGIAAALPFFFRAALPDSPNINPGYPPPQDPEHGQREPEQSQKSRAFAEGISDYDLFYFDADDLSREAEDVVIGNAAELFADLDVVVEVCNEARVHLWYEEHFGVPAKAFDSSRDAIDHFASTTCCYAVTRDSAGELDVYAPHGYDDLFDQRLRPNPVLAPRHVYERKAARWVCEWPRLSVEPWPGASASAAGKLGG